MNRVVIIDLESTCWEGAPPPGETSDIIEIGVCTLDPVTLKIERPMSIPVRPVRSQVTPFCTKLNGWTPEAAAGGLIISKAFAVLQDEYDTKRSAWISWGGYDRKMIEKTATDFALNSPVSRRHLNLKTLFAIWQGLDREVGMDAALKILELPLEGRHHSGVDDACNIASILRWFLLRARGLNRVQGNIIDDPRL